MIKKHPTHGHAGHKPRRRRKSGLSAAPKRRRTHHRKSGGLADMFNPTIAMNSAKDTLMSAGGGLGAMIVNKSILPSTSTKTVKVLTALGVGFFASAMGMGQLGHGFTGGMVALTFQNGLLNDDMQDTDFAEENVLNDYPPVLDEQGNPMILEEGDGEPYYRPLNDYELSQYDY